MVSPELSPGTILHAMANVSDEYDLIVLLQPTSPLRTVTDIDGSIETCLSRNAPACVTLCETEKHPLWMYYLQDDNVMVPILDSQEMPQRRQNLPAAFILNGAVYVGRSKFLRRNKSFFHKKTVGYVMPKERSIDIDNESDLKNVKTVVRSGNKYTKQITS